MSLHACDKCLRPMNESEVCWRKDIVDGKPVMAPMCEDCWEEFVWGPTDKQGKEGGAP